MLDLTNKRMLNANLSLCSNKIVKLSLKLIPFNMTLAIIYHCNFTKPQLKHRRNPVSASQLFRQVSKLWAYAVSLLYFVICQKLTAFHSFRVRFSAAILCTSLHQSVPEKFKRCIYVTYMSYLRHVYKNSTNTQVIENKTIFQ